jgi:hypothetical protein
MTARSKAGTFLARSNAMAVGLNSTRGLDVYAFIPLVAVLRLADPQSRESYRLYTGLRN